MEGTGFQQTFGNSQMISIDTKGSQNLNAFIFLKFHTNKSPSEPSEYHGLPKNEVKIKNFKASKLASTSSSKNKILTKKGVFFSSSGI